MTVQRFGKPTLEVEMVATVRKMSEVFPEINMIGAAYILSGKTVTISVKIDDIEYISSLSEKRVVVIDKKMLSGEVVYEVRADDDNVYFLYEDWLENIHEESYEVPDEDIKNLNRKYNQWKNDKSKYDKEKYILETNTYSYTWNGNKS